MKKAILLGACMVLLISAGCAQQQIYRSSPEVRIVSTHLFDVQLEPVRAEGYNYYNGFRFVFVNKSAQDLVIDWAETFYLQNGRRYGRFGWEGLTFKQLKELKEEPEITVAAGRTITAILFPLKLVGWRQEAVRKKDESVEAGFTRGMLPAGKNGISLAVRQGGKPIRKDVVVTITLD